jgi:glycosyltransferase involved in cell wall biosynthesis
MKNKSLTLSIVIPVYNEQAYLRGCLDSIASQTVKPAEVIVVDNNSKDNSRSIAASYDFVKVIPEKRQGIEYARNKGFDTAKSDIIGRIDADTHLHADWVKQTILALQGCSAAAVTGDCYFYDFPFRNIFHSVHKFVYYTLQKWVAGTEVLWGSNMAIRKTVWNDIAQHKTPMSDKFTHEDIDLTLNLKRHKYKIKHDKKMQATVSLRRGDLGIRSLNRYLSAWHQTYIRNGLYIRVLPILLLEFITFLSAILVWPFHKVIR